MSGTAKPTSDGEEDLIILCETNQPEQAPAAINKKRMSILKEEKKNKAVPCQFNDYIFTWSVIIFLTL